MKIITNDKVYIQKKDLRYLMVSDLNLPLSFFKLMSKPIIITSKNEDEFIEIIDPDLIKYFTDLDWMIDYNSVKELTDEQLIEYGESIVEERNKIAEKFNDMTEKEKEKNLNLIIASELLEYKLISLRDILWHNQGHLAFPLPTEAGYSNLSSKTSFWARLFSKKSN